MVAVALVALAISTVTAVEVASDKRIMGVFTFSILGTARRPPWNGGHLLPPVPSRYRRISRRPLVRHGLLDVRLAGDPWGSSSLRGAALLGVAMLLLVVYMTTWD